MSPNESNRDDEGTTSEDDVAESAPDGTELTGAETTPEPDETRSEDSGSGDGGTEEGETEKRTSDPGSISNIERVRLNPNDVVGALAYNGQEDVGKKGKAVFSLRPPFDEAVEPTLQHLDEDSTESKTKGEIHLRPFRFVFEGRQVIEQRPTRQLAIEELEEADPDDASIEAWIDDAMETWKSHVRENLAESVDIFSPHGMTIVNVEYESGSDTEDADPA
jgi:hypothetical protein